MSEARCRVVINGVVQGVWFRESTRRVASGLGLSGWVRNLADGSVEAVFEGPADKVASALAWSRHGPDRAIVTDVQEYAEKPEGLTGFHIRPTDY